MSIRSLEADCSRLSSVGCGGVIKRAFFPQNVTELTEITKLIANDEYVALGGLTNTLVLDEFDGTAVFGSLMKGISVFGDKIRVKSGENFAKVCGAAQYSSLGGMEAFFGLPGTIGGAIFGNSGCFGSEISDFIEEITVFRLDDGETETLTREEIAFGYRYSNLRKNKDFIVDATFRLYPEKSRVIAEKMAQTRKMRQIKQPKGKSLGSFFKQYGGVSAGYYIEKSGLKGYEKNGVKVSETHANFLMNESGNASDYLLLGEFVEKTVFEKFGIKLVREVNVVGEENRKRNSDG